MHSRSLGTTVFFWIWVIAAAIHCSRADCAPAPNPSVFVRVSLISPADRAWRVHVIVHTPGPKPLELFVGKTQAAAAKGVAFLPAQSATAWMNLADAGLSRGATVRFLVETEPPLADAGVEMKIDLATAENDGAILKSITDHDPGNVVSIRIPPNPAENKEKILSIRQDTQRRLDELTALHLPDGPRPKKIWCMTGFRSNGQFYTDPKIAAIDFDIVRMLGMNGWWEQNGGQPGDLRKLASEHGLDRSTVYWRSVESLPRDNSIGGVTRLQWDKLDAFLGKVYHDDISRTRARNSFGLPEVLADLMDEPAGQVLGGPEYLSEFRQYAQGQGLSPEFFGKKTWDDVIAFSFNWRTFFSERAKLAPDDENARRLFYWSLRFWNYSTARLYALATRNVEQDAPGTATRINCGPPWVYDYGTLPRGIDIFEFGRLRSVTIGFNEDWVGKGNPRVPLEMNTLLMDWSRAAARPNTPLLGSYITRDADRPTVKLRTFACLAREAKIFDFYYYGPAYTFFDHWSDNASMVQGVAELTRDIGALDDTLWDGRAPKAQVALLYSHSWPVWKLDDTEQCEQMMAYLALLHAGIPVDIVSDAEVSDGRFGARRYKALYVVNESIPTAAMTAIDCWVQDGGHLWAGGWAGMNDEYNTPSGRWNQMLHVKSRSYKPTGDLKRLGQEIQPADWTRPIIGRETTCVLLDDASVKRIETSAHEPKAYRHQYGDGMVQVVPWTAGKAYMDAATEKAGSLAKATIYPDDDRRKIYADFALEAGATPPATTSVSQVLAWPLWTQHNGVVLLANYTGEPAAAVHVTLAVPMPITSARALHGGNLELAHPDAEHVEFTVPMKDVTDMIELE